MGLLHSNEMDPGEPGLGHKPEALEAGQRKAKKRHILRLAKMDEDQHCSVEAVAVRAREGNNTEGTA